MKKNLHDSVQEAVQKAWSDALSSLHGLEDEVTRRFRLLKERANLQQGSEELQRVISDLGKRFQQNSDALEKRVDDSVRSFYSKMRKPIADELASLKSKAEQIGQRIESQIHRRGPAGEGESTPEESAKDEAPPAK